MITQRSNGWSPDGDRVVVDSHDLSGCVQAAIASSTAGWSVLQTLPSLPTGTLAHDPKWQRTHTQAHIPRSDWLNWRSWNAP